LPRPAPASSTAQHDERTRNVDLGDGINDPNIDWDID